MKKSTAIVRMICTMCIVAFTFMACNNELAISPDEKEQGSTQLVDEVMALPHRVVPLGYAKLSGAEKVVLWNKHIDKYLSSNKLSKDVIAHIELLRKFNTIEIFENANDPLIKERIAKFEKSWLVEPLANGTIPREVLFRVGTLAGLGVAEADLGSLNSRVSAKASEGGSGGATCECRYDLGCLGWDNTCDKGNCRDAYNSSCGVFGTSNCTGKCRVA
ncbi:bacteriocin fulvocin C-related protein [Dyadobacter chenwenxiniae]|uniref:Bacteriocin fulvocin C-related protein n=1 Tax=Dyadobacter chenwenxiniae TaxID=2906456 RepID=A0A9X1TCZ0_9BACT|nr:bacteriocin fulvocin C-related protein [Dyadobacter chenwenxiniae]MCF0061346.1 bacteriocin fulvocin C-related protein [Dyadobacter chenwenxiniae]UON81168.1 bacteriocin fulvocin C-related protein [Dyadobacter chenwenxiniae]